MGHDVLTIQETGKAGQSLPDSDNLNRAIRQHRVVRTYNRKDFIRLHKQRPDHEGIIVCTADEGQFTLPSEFILFFNPYRNIAAS